jgi:hypothetical protein
MENALPAHAAVEDHLLPQILDRENKALNPAIANARNQAVQRRKKAIRPPISPLQPGRVIA